MPYESLKRLKASSLVCVSRGDRRSEFSAPEVLDFVTSDKRWQQPIVLSEQESTMNFFIITQSGFNGPSSQIRAPIANQSYQDDISTGRLMFCEYGTEPNDEHIYMNNIQSFNKPSSPAIEGHAANQTYQDDKKKGQQPKRYWDRSGYVINHESCFCLILLGNNCFIDNNKNDV